MGRSRYTYRRPFSLDMPQNQTNKPHSTTLIVNKPNIEKKVLSTISGLLRDCCGYNISVAFITTSGVACIIEKLKYLEENGIRGRILTSTYLNFTQPEALSRLLQFKNLEVRIETRKAFHSKGYLFEIKPNQYDLVLGSSNLTQSALTTNIELNVKLQSLSRADDLIVDYLADFEEQWESATAVNQEFIQGYESLYDLNKQTHGTLQVEESVPAYGIASTQTFQPNAMQVDALEALEQLRADGQQKGLVISATGTGKTFLSAFDVQRVNPNRILFIVHRRTIAEKSLESYQAIMPDKSMALYSGPGRKDTAQYLFATIQSVANDIEKFERDAYDYIVIDETHRAEATTYQRVMNYFQPYFMLGMTATPERTDGIHVFSLFDHNIAYEIRLHQALKEKMLVPFHYYGVSDLTIDGEQIDDNTEFNKLCSPERIKHILHFANFYGACDKLIRGLVFVSSINEAMEMARQFNEAAVPTIALTGRNSHEERQAAIDRLESGEIRYIISIDIFNEGVDIPSVNQVLMIRPTQSAIIYVQQLGRGLRKAENKHYLTVVDFIANYKNLFLVPIALYGDTSFNKDNLRKLLVGESQGLPGACTIDFDRIAQQQIFDSIDQSNLRKFSDLKLEYKLLKNVLGRTPMMMDFYSFGKRDPYQFIEAAKSYFEFVQRADNEVDLILSEFNIELLGYLQQFVNDTKRGLESEILISLIQKDEYVFKEVELQYVKDAVHVINLNFDYKRHNHSDMRISEKLDITLAYIEGRKVLLTGRFRLILDDEIFKDFLLDSAIYGKSAFKDKVARSKIDGGFILHEKYSRRDVLRLLNWDKNRNAATLGGYRMSPDGTNCPIWVTYNKHEVEDRINYADEFMSPTRFQWMSRSRRKKGSRELQPIINAAESGVRLPFFIKKSDIEGRDYYYLGDVLPVKDSIEDSTMPDGKGGELNVVKFEFEFEHKVPDELYNYLVK